MVWRRTLYYCGSAVHNKELTCQLDSTKRTCTILMPCWPEFGNWLPPSLPAVTLFPTIMERRTPAKKIAVFQKPSALAGKRATVGCGPFSLKFVKTGNCGFVVGVRKQTKRQELPQGLTAAPALQRLARTLLASPGKREAK